MPDDFGFSQLVGQQQTLPRTPLSDGLFQSSANNRVNNGFIDVGSSSPGNLTPQDFLMRQAKEQYPVLKQYDIPYKNTPNGGNGYLESWPAGETGGASQPRPAELPIGKFGVENYSPKTRPIDILGDVASHHLIEADPKIKRAYEDFSGSLQPWQHDRLQEQYHHARQNGGEQRPYENWKQTSGIPAYFRGHPFQQWGDDAKSMYTPEQIQKLDDMMKYLQQK